MIAEEMTNINAMFHVACTRRGQRRERAWNELREELRSKLWSQHNMYQQELMAWKVRATEKSKNEVLNKRVEILEESVMNLHGEKYAFKNENRDLKLENRDLKLELKTLKEKLNYKENGGEIAGAAPDEQ